MGRTRGGGSMVSRPPVFSNDGLKLLLCTGNIVSVFSTKTSLLTAELAGHSAQVTGVVVVPVTHLTDQSHSRCWTCSLDATLRLWDFDTGSLLKTLSLSSPIEYMAIPRFSSASIAREDKGRDTFVFLSARRREGEKSAWSGCTLLYNLTKMKPIKGGLGKTYKPRPVVASPCGKFAGLVDKNKIVIWKSDVGNIDSANKIRDVRLRHTKTLSTLAFHPSDAIVAGGDIAGRILIWREVGRNTFSNEGMANGRQKLSNNKISHNRVLHGGRDEEDDASALTTWHWHHSEVHFLSFSSDGCYLFSGGKEGVFVIWQIETGTKRFLPRLGGPLLFLSHSPEPSLFSISCADNRILFVNISSMEIERSIDGIKPPVPLPEKAQHFRFANVAADYKAGMLVLPSENHSVQFYDVYYERPVFEVKITQRNYVFSSSPSEFVTTVSVSPSGSTMGTVEYKHPEDNSGGEISLKFWNIEARNRRFSLSTIIYDPHGEAGISCLAFHPHRKMAVSCAYNGNFKVWVGIANDQKRDEYSWRCRSVASYRKKAMTCAAFATDGSLLAVGAGDLVTLWNPETNSLITVIGGSLMHMPYSTISAVHFISKSPHLVTVTNDPTTRLSVWNLSTLSVWWSYELSVVSVAADPDKPNFVALVNLPFGIHKKWKGEEDSVMVLFNTENPIPVSAWVVRKGRGGKVFFIQQKSSLDEDAAEISDASGSVVVFVNRDHEYAILNPYSGDSGSLVTLRSRYSEAKDEDTTLYGYESIFGKTSLLERNTDIPQSDAKQTVNLTATNNSWEKLLDGPSHVLPPLTRIGTAFIESLLSRRTGEVM